MRTILVNTEVKTESPRYLSPIFDIKCNYHYGYIGLFTVAITVPVRAH